MSEYVIRPLDANTWDAFAGLAERHNGVWGGCWCTWFHGRADLRICEGPNGRHNAMSHRTCAEKGQTVEGNRALKERLVNEGRAHAALVFDGDVAVAWCEYGSPEELPNIYHRKEYEAGLDRGIFPLQRHPKPLRTGRLQLRPAQGDEELRDEQDGPARLETDARPCIGSSSDSVEPKSFHIRAQRAQIDLICAAVKPPEPDPAAARNGVSCTHETHPPAITSRAPRTWTGP